MNTRPTSFFNKLSVFVAMTSHLHHGSVSVTLVAAFAALGSLWLNRFLSSDLDLPLVADDDLVIDHDGDSIDDAFQAQLAVHLMPVRAVADAEMHGAQSFFLAAH